MINNKGFTLIELLAVMVILVGISLVAVGGISASLERREEKEHTEQIELAIGAAKIYFSLNDVTCVTINQLINSGYFSSEKKIDSLKGTYTISLSEDEYVYSSTLCS